MQWFILSRDMHVLCAPSTDSPNSLPIFNDKQTILLSNNTVVSTYDFSVQQKHPDAQYLQMGNYVVFVDKYHKTKMYTLMSHDGDDLTHTWHAEDVGLDLLNESSEKWDYTGQPHDIAWYLNNLVLKDSGWTIGINEASTLTRALKFDGETDTQLRRLGDIANQFDGAEVDFTIEMNGAQVTKQFVNIYKKVGSAVTQGRYIDSVNLKSLHSSGSIGDLITAVKPFGAQMDMPEGQEGEAPRINITDVTYDDGRYYSPKGHLYLYDREARQQWSRFRAYNYANQGEFDGYIVGSYTYDTKDPNDLLKRALTELKSRNKPSETYEANLLDINADIGDYVQIAHNQYNPPIYLSARVESVTNCYTANGQDTGVLGDYRKLESDIDPRIKEMLNALENQIKSHYMWIRYAEDDKGKGMTSVPTVGTKYIAILVNKPTAIPSDNPADYAGHWQLIQGQDGPEGIPGPKGEDGRTSYTHFAYANNVSGTADFSLDDPTGRSYMGVYSDFTKADSNKPSDYVWSLTKGETGPEGMQGAQGPKGDIGIPGKPGADGKTSYTHVAYADNDKGGGFSQSPANKAYMGWYSDFTENDSTDTTKYAWSLIKGSDGLDGAQGIPGPKGADGKTPYTHIAYADTATGSGLSQLPDGKKYIGMYVDFTENDSGDPQKYAWSLIKGADGKDGTPGKDGIAGKDGIGIKSTTVTYQASSNGTTAPTGAWTANVPTVPAGQYLWTRTIWTYTDNTDETSYSVAYIAKDGNSGKDGIAGKDGVGIKSTTITYATSTSGTVTPTTGWVTNPPAVSPGQFMWTKTVWNYTDNSSETGYSVAQAGNTGATGPVGRDGIAGKDGVGIKSTAIAYAQSTGGTTPPTTGWTAQVPTLIKGQYLWTQTTWLYTDNTGEAGYTVSYNAKDGNNGTDGIAGKDGVGIKSTTITYQSGTSGTVQPTGAWVSNPPSVAGGNYLWTRTIWSYTDGTSETGYSVAKMGEKGAQGPQGLQGLQGATGNQGIQGPKGLDGKSSYTHIAYGTSNSGAGFTQTPSTSTTYIGMYVDQTATDSADPKKYAWSLIKGADGTQGTPGAKGADGKTPYFHSAWANSVDGKTGFSTTDSVNKSYLGTYTDFTQGDSADPTKYAWSLIKGADGINGKDGIPGKAGADGKTPYFHTAWATSADGKNGFSLTDSANKSYLGTYTDFTKADSTDTTKYAWSLIKGRDGSNGAPGKAGTDGKTPYFHQAWADSKDGKINFSTTDPTNRGYLGTYSDFTQADSADPSKYFWVELVGNLVIGGRNYLLDTGNAKPGVKGSGGGNQTHSNYLFSFGSIKNAPFTDGDPVTVSFSYLNSGTGVFGTILTQLNTTPWSQFGLTENMKEHGRVTLTTTWQSSWSTSLVTGIHIRMDNVATTRTVMVYNVQFESGNKATDHKVAPEDTQGQIDKVNNGLEHVEGLYNSILTPIASVTAPINPKTGQQWWVLDANGRTVGFKIWNGSTWADATIQQSAMNIGTLNGNIINGATINSSNFNVSYDETKENTGRPLGPYFKGTQVIKNGSYLSNYQVKGSTQTGYTYLTPDGLQSRINNNDGSLLSQVSIGMGSLSLKDATHSGDLYPADVERTSREVWDTTDPINGIQHMGLSKQFRRVWLDGSIFLVGRNDNPILKLKNPKLYPNRDVYLTLGGLGDSNIEAQIHINPYGNLWAMSVSNPNKRYICEGAYYMLDS
ncbi:phage tail spike protein [Latilactobacillus curvatus]|uniref:phage tail spike protein n=1 Tax=Latilactobacillus curvatus TaxID=28038 RepID=UPI00280A6081|nr:phage tail spike protein [Latilactobacillus curvatus]